MKTLTVLLVATAVSWAVPARAQNLHETLHCAEHAHELAVAIVELTVPHAHCDAAWNRAAQRAVATDAAVETVLAALSIGDYCTARDAADALKDLADDLQDDAEDLSPAVSPYGPRIGRDEVRQIERLADDLESHARNLRRETKRLDKAGYVAGPPAGTIYGAPLPGGATVTPIRPIPGYGLVPGGTPWGFEGSRRFGRTGQDDGRRRYRTGPQNASPFEDSFGPGQSVPPADFGQPSSVTVPGPTLPSQGHRQSDRPSAEKRRGTAPPVQARKIQQRQPGPTLFAPNASRDGRPHR